MTKVGDDDEDINASDIIGMQKMIEAVYNKNLNGLKDIWGRYSIAIMKIKDINGRSLLHIAAEKGQSEMMNFLIKKGVDINSQDLFGNTPLHYSVHG